MWKLPELTFCLQLQVESLADYHPHARAAASSSTSLSSVAIRGCKKGKELGTGARALVGEVATIKSMDIVLPVRSGGQATKLRLRTISRRDRRVAELLHRLGLAAGTQPRDRKWSAEKRPCV